MKKQTKQQSPRKSKPRSSATADQRPIRDQNFIKEAKEKIIKLLQDTEFPRQFLLSDFAKITTSDVKAIVEHFMCQFDPKFRLNEFDPKLDNVKTSEDRIVYLFLNGLNYKNHLTKTHIASPSVQSSIPFMIGALDFLRRLVTVYLNIYPSHMYPISPYNGISSEQQADVLIRVFKVVELIDTIDSKALLSNFEIEMQAAFDIKSEAEIAQMSENVDLIENLQTEIDQLEREIEIFENRSHKLGESMQENARESHQLMQKFNLISDEIRESQSDLDCLIMEEMRLNQRKDKFEEQGYTEQIKQIDELEEVIDKIQSHFLQLKMERDEKENRKRQLNNEMTDARFATLNGFKDIFESFPNGINNEIQKILIDLKIDDLQKFEIRLEPYLTGLIESLEKENQQCQESVHECTQSLEIMQQEFDTLSRDIKSIEFQLQSLKEEDTENKVVVENLHKQRMDNEQKIQDRVKQIDKEHSEIQLLEETLVIKKNQFEELKEWKGQSKQYFDVDLDFEKELAEIRLQCLQDGFDLRMSLKKGDEQCLEEMKKFVVINEIEYENLEKNFMEFCKKEFEK